MKKICFISINARYTHLNLAALYLREIIRDLPYEFILKEFIINEDPLDILEQISEAKPDIIAFSVYIWNTRLVKIILPEIKKILPNAIIILGGPEVSYNSREWLKNFSCIDFIIKGKGEKGFYELLKHSCKSKRKVICLKNYPLRNLYFPYTKGDFPRYKDCYIYYESSRGCGFKCAYCLSSLKEQVLEYRPLDKVFKELDFLLNENPKIIKFTDRTFNLNKKHYRAIWDYLISKETATVFHFEIHPFLLDESDFTILKRIPAGKFQFEIGVQSINPDTIKSVNRRDDWEKSFKNIKRLTDLKTIRMHIGLIAGLPYETFDLFKETFNKTFELNPDYFQLGFLKVLPGTLIQKKSGLWGIEYLASSNYQVLKTKWISFEELAALRKMDLLLDLIHNSRHFVKTEEYLFSYFSSPFEFYFHLSKHMKQTLDFRDWNKMSALILDFVNVKLPERKDVILDALRWDWCYISNANYYPSHLRIG
ncbi:MAG: Radical SAM protein, partial [uncultured bacterium]